MKASILIPFDTHNRNYMVVRSTNWHPRPAFRHRIKGVGGIVEDGEQSLDAVLREMQEEFPGWFRRIPGSSSSWGESPNKVRATQALAFVATIPSTDGWEWDVFVAPTDLGIKSFQQARSVATESSPEIWSLGVLPKEEDCLPDFAQCIRAATQFIANAYPSLGLGPC